jgi:putative transposase
VPEYGISEATYVNRRMKYAGMTVGNQRRLNTLEVENRRLKQIVAEQALDNRSRRASSAS